MLEIAILIVLAGRIGKIVEEKGRKKIGYQLMLVGMWIGAELFGGIAGGLIAVMTGGTEDGAMLFGAIGGLGCAVGAAIVAFQIAKNLQPVEGEDEFYRGMDYADDPQVRKRFGDRGRAYPAADAFTDDGEKSRRALDDRIQE